MRKHNFKFSVVINTLNRGPELQNTLESLRWLKYSEDFEVVVVNGPSTDNSDEVIKSWLPGIRAGKCDVANLSVSRNIGICMAQGEIVAFIDDDAIPEPEWLAQLAKAFQDPMVGAAGGLVYNHTGYDFQYKYCTVDRFGNADLSRPGPEPHFSFPKSRQIPHLLGCNSAFRRASLIEIGGFDEEYEYFLDETDVCLRIVDAGYIIEQIPAAYVHHKFAPSNIRGDNKVLRNRYPVIKNKIYFTHKNAREFYSFERILEEQQAFILNQRNDVNWAFGENLLSENDVTNFESDLEHALEVGLRRGFEGVSADAMIDDEKIQKYSDHFLPFKSIENDAFRTIILISRDFPPNHGGGIATFNKDLAEALAAQGNIVHIVTQSPDINRVDFESGVWVHRMVLNEMEFTAEAIEQNIPQHIWNWSATALKEVNRIATHRPIDVVEAPIWDCEGIAFLFDGQWPLVTSLQTTLHFWLDSHPELKQNEGWMNSFGSPMLALEKKLMLHADAIRSISSAIRRDIESAYKFFFDKKKLCITPLGMPYEESITMEKETDNTLTVLFVGRLEHRKGIDVLLDAIPKVLCVNENIKFRIIGDDTLLKPGEKITYKDEYLASEDGKHWSTNVQFEGRVDNNILDLAYKSCDIFVAPSRFESFGLIILEAMREGKPVIACSTGGMPELVTNDENGLLIKPDDVGALTEAISTLSQSVKLRTKMGEAGRKIFLDKFTSKAMAQSSLDLYDMAKKNYRQANS